jgi:hypothetical protein
VNVLPEQKRPGNPEEVSELTRERVEQIRKESRREGYYFGLVAHDDLNALCDLALRALAPPQIQEQAGDQSGASSGSPDAVQEQRSGDLAGGNSGVIDQITATPQAGDLGSVPL